MNLSDDEDLEVFELNTELELFVNVNIIVKCVEHGVKYCGSGMVMEVDRELAKFKVAPSTSRAIICPQIAARRMKGRDNV